MTCNSPNLDLVNINGYIKLDGNLSICSQDKGQIYILALINGYNFGINERKMTCNNLKLDIVIRNAYIK